MVFIRGALKAKETLDTTTAQKAFTLPVIYRPTQLQDFLCQGSSKNTWLCEITSSGVVSVGRYGSTEVGKISTSSWLPITASFLVG
jgi:hypothetical protein